MKPEVPRQGDPREHGHHLAWASGLVRLFIDSKLTLLVIFFSILLGGFAVLRLPRGR